MTYQNEVTMLINYLFIKYYLFTLFIIKYRQSLTSSRTVVLVGRGVLVGTKLLVPEMGEQIFLQVLANIGKEMGKLPPT